MPNKILVGKEERINMYIYIQNFGQLNCNLYYSIIIGMLKLYASEVVLVTATLEFTSRRQWYWCYYSQWFPV